jgi:hypothetical protein
LTIRIPTFWTRWWLTQRGYDSDPANSVHRGCRLGAGCERFESFDLQVGGWLMAGQLVFEFHGLADLVEPVPELESVVDPIQVEAGTYGVEFEAVPFDQSGSLAVVSARIE